MAREADKALPHNFDAERSVLGAILLDNAYLAEAQKVLHSSDDFFLHQNRLLYAEMLALRDSGAPIDLVTLGDWLARKEQLEAAGGAAYIASLMDGVPKVSNVAHYAAIVREKAARRVLIHATHAMQQSAFEEHEPSEQLIARCVESLTELAARKGASANGNGTGQRHPAYTLGEFLRTQFPIPDHLVEGLIPRGGSVLVLAMPHRLKSWFTTGLALGCTRPGKVFGCLEVLKPVRTLLVQVEDPEGVVQDRMQQLILSNQFADCDTEAVRVIGRKQFLGGFTKEWSAWLREQAREFGADLVIMDVLRRFFVGQGDLNSPGDSGDFLEEIDLIRDLGAAVVLVHHENRKDAELMSASAGSYNFPGWANVVIQLKRKTESGQGADRVTRVEIEADNKLGQAPDSLRLVLNLNSPDAPLRLEEIGEGDDWREVMEHLGDQWTVKDLAEELGVHRRSAQRRIKSWIDAGKVERISGGKGGRGAGGLARYRFRDLAAQEEIVIPPKGRIQ